MVTTVHLTIKSEMYVSSVARGGARGAIAPPFFPEMFVEYLR